MSRLFISACTFVVFVGFGFCTDAFGISSRTQVLDVTSRSQLSDASYIAMHIPGIPIRRVLGKLNPFKGKRKTCSSSALKSAAATSVPAVAAPKEDKKSLAETLKVGFYFALWYAFNIGYNIYNKKVLNAIPTLTWTVAVLQLVLGLLYVLPLWAFKVRKTPALTNDDVKNMVPTAILHTLTHIGAVISLGAGAVSFTHIVKAAEPAVSAFLSAVFLKSFLPLPVYLSLLPVMGGVAMASLTELSFTWLSFGSAMVSNVASAARGIVGKKQMGMSAEKNMDAANVYAVTSILASIILIPFALIKEAHLIGPVINSVKAAGTFKTVAIQTILSGLYYYLYNEVAFLCLDNVQPVTHALGNTIKRVVIIVTSVLVLGSKMTTQGAIGSSIAILGVLLYSLTKAKCK